MKWISPALMVQAIIAAAMAWALTHALPAHGIHGTKALSFERLLAILIKTRTFGGLFKLCWVMTGMMALVAFIQKRATFNGSAIALFVVMFGVLIPCLGLPKLTDNQQLVACLASALPLMFLMGIDMDPAAVYTQFVRGTEIMSGRKGRKLFARLLAQETKQGDKAGLMFWDEARLPFSKENQHLLVVGSPGSGKTQIIYPLALQAFARGDKLVIWDVKGTYTQALMGQSGVQLLAPWDKRSLAWSPGKDIVRPLDCHQAASVLIPENPRDPQPFFSNAARQILEAVLIQLDAGGNAWGWQDVWDTIAQGKESLIKTLQRSSDGRAAAGVISGDSKGSQDVYATLLSSTQPIKWLAKAWPKDGASLRQWVRSESNGQVLILGGTPQHEKLAGSVASLAIQVMVNEVNSLPDDLNRRIWFFLDELASLGRIDAIARLSTMGRSKGGCVVAGIQDIGQIEHLYGRELARSLANTFRTTIILRCADSATSEWAAGTLGKQEVIERRRTWSEGSHSGSAGVHSNSGSSQSESTQEVTREKHAFMPSEIANFNDMEGIFRLAGWPVAHLGWPKQQIPQDAPLVEEAAWVNQKAQLDSGPSTSEPDLNL